MADPIIRLKRSSTPGKIPTTADLQLGELAVNTHDGKAYLKKDVGGIETVVNLGGGYPGQTYYVTKTGLDTNDGQNISAAFATLKKALTVAVAGDTIQISSGTFTEIFPLTVPQGVTVRGNGIRSTFIQPTSGTERNDAFLLNGETTVEDLSLGNFYYNSSTDTGYGFRFAPNMVTTTRSPYIQRITVLNKGSTQTANDPYGFDTVDNYPTSKIAGRGVLIDASVVQSTTLEPAMLFNECTFITPNQTALKMINGARTEWVNCFTYFASVGIEGVSGNVGVASTANVQLKLSGITTSISQNYVIKYYQGGTPVAIGTVVSVDGDYVNILGKGSGLFNSVGIGSTQDVRIFQSNGTTQVGTASTILWADYQKFGADMRSIGSATNFGTVGVRGDGKGVQLRLFGFNFGCVGSGKTFTQDPTITIKENEAIQLNGGRVYFQSVDQAGNFRVGNLLEIGQETGLVSIASTSDISVTGTLSLNRVEVAGIATFNSQINHFSNTFNTNQANYNLINANATRLNFAGDATDILIGSPVGVSTIRNYKVNLSGGQESYTSADGTLVVTGGVGIGSNLNVGKDLKVSGVSTFVSPVRLDSQIRVAGVSTFVSDSMFNANLLASGIATVGNFRVTGVSTFTGDVNLTNNLNIGGITTTSTFRVTGISTLTGDVELGNNLRVAGVSTFNNSTMINSNLNVTGITTTSTFRVTGISTLTGDVEFNNNIRVSGIGTIGNLRVTGFSTLTDSAQFGKDVLVSGITTLTTLRVTGISTLTGDTEFTNNIRVSGITTLTTLRVTGISTLTGDTEFTNNIRVSGIGTIGNLRVTGVSTLTGDTNLTNNLNVSGITTTGNFRVTGVSTLTGDTNFTNNINVGGITTTSTFRVTGISTLSGDVELGNNLRVAGISTFQNTISHNSSLFVTNQSTYRFIDTTTTTVTAFGDATSIGIGSTNASLTLRPSTLIGANSTQNLYNTVATTVNAFGAATSINIGANSGTLTVGNPIVVGTQVSQNLYDNVATTISAFGSATTISIGATTASLTLRPSTVVGVNATQNLYNTVATTVNAFGAASSLNVGANTGTLTIGNPTVVGTQATQNLYNTVATNVNAFGAATALNLGATTGISTINNPTLSLPNASTINVNGANPTISGSSTGTLTLFNSNLTSVNAFGAASNILLGATTGVTTIRNLIFALPNATSFSIDGANPTISGASTGTLTLFNTNLTTVNAFGAATTLNLGAATGTATVNNPTISLANVTTLNVNGANPTIAGSSTGTLTLFNTNLTTVNAFGSATSINIGAATGTATVNNPTVTLANATTLNVNGANPTIAGSSTGTLTLFNTNLTRVNAFQAATDNVLFATTGVTTVRNNLSVTGTLTAGNFTTAGIATFTGAVNNINQTAGTAALNRLTVTGVSTVSDLNVTGTLSLNGSSTVSGTQNITNLNVTGVSTVSTLNVNGNLTVNGTTTTLNSNVLSIDDKYIALGDVIARTGLTATLGVGQTTVTVTSTTGLLGGQTLTKTSGAGAFGASARVYDVLSATQFTTTVAHATAGAITFNVGGASDLTADGGGILIKGTTDKYIQYNDTFKEFAVSENINLSNTNTSFRIAGVDLLTSTQLSITNAIITGVGTIGTINATDLTGNNLQFIGVSTLTQLEGTFLNYDTSTINNLTAPSITCNGSAFISTCSGLDLSYSGQSLLGNVSATRLDITDINSVGVSTLPNIFNSTIDSFAHYVGISSIGNLYNNIGFTTDLNVKYFTLTNSITDIVTQPNTTIGVTTNRIGIPTAGVAIGDVVTTTGSEFLGTSETTVINIFGGDIVEFTPSSINPTQTTTSTIRIYRDPRAGVASVTTLKANTGIVTNFEATSSTIGVSTITRLVITNNTYSSGIASIGSLYVDTGITTTLSGTNISYSGVGTINTLKTNIGFVTFVQGTNLWYSGISTLPTLYTNVGLVTFLTGTNLNYSGIGTVDVIRSNVGFITNISGTDLQFTGVATVPTLRVNTGFVTTISGTRATYQDIDNTNIYNTGIASFTNLRTNIGIATFLTGTNLNYSGIGTITNIFSDYHYSGISSAGTTYSVDGLYTGNLTVNNISGSTGGFVNFDVFNFNASGITSITNLNVTNVAITSAVGDNFQTVTINCANFISTNIYSPGITSTGIFFADSGFTTYFNATNGVIGLGTITEFNNTNLFTTGIGTINNFYSGIGIVTFLSGTNIAYSGIATIDTLRTNAGFITSLSGTDIAYSGIGTIDTLRTNVGFVTYLSGTNLSYVGVSTLGTVYAADLTLNNITNSNTISSPVGLISYVSGRNLDYTGIGTIDTFKSNVGLVTFLTGTDLEYSGIASIGTLRNNIGVTTYFTSTNSYTSGIGTILSFYANTGVVTTLSGTRATYQDIDGTRLFVTGITTLTSLVVNSGVVTYLSGTNSVYSGISTVGFLSATNANISGITTINTLLISPNNRLTHLSDGTDLEFNGIGTIRTLRTNTGFVTSISGTNLFYSGIGTITTIQNVDLTNTGVANLNKLNVADGSVLSGVTTCDQIITTSIQTTSLDLSGSGLVYTGVATFFRLNTVDGSDIPNLTNNNIISTGIGTFNYVNAVNINAPTGVTTVGQIRVGYGGTILTADARSGIGSVGINTSNPRNALHVYGSIQINNNTVYGTVSAALTAAVSTPVHQGLSRDEFRSVEYTVQASIGNTHQVTKILSIHDGVTAYNSEYSNISTGVDVANYDVDIDNSIPPGYIRLNVTPVSNTGITTVVVNFIAHKI